MIGTKTNISFYYENINPNLDNIGMKSKLGVFEFSNSNDIIITNKDLVINTKTNINLGVPFNPSRFFITNLI